MTTEAPEAAPGAALEAAYEPHATVAALTRYFMHMTPGDMASVRRSPDLTTAFFRVGEDVLQPRGMLAGGALGVSEQERRWAHAVHLTARLHAAGLCSLRRRAGEALAEFLSEMRLNRLLEVRGEPLRVEVRRVVGHAISARAALHPADLADLILGEGTDRHDTSRTRLARDYVRGVHNATKTRRGAP